MNQPAVKAVRVTVPASTANLGSGFDTLGMALGLYDVVEVETSSSGLRVEVRGQGAGQLPNGEEHLVVRAIRAACSALGINPFGLIVRCANEIPQGRGLGSSAAAVVAGIAAGYALAGQAIDENALQLAAEFEGHADNAAASLLGGAVIAWTEKSQQYRAIRIEPHAELRAIALIPAVESSTKMTRSLLPAMVPHSDAAFAAARAALAGQALTARPDLLLPATEDRLHQNYREPAWPSTIRVVHALRSCGIAAFVSGAGPTVLALVTRHVNLVNQVDLEEFQLRELEIDRTGVMVSTVE